MDIEEYFKNNPGLLEQIENSENLKDYSNLSLEELEKFINLMKTK